MPTKTKITIKKAPVKTKIAKKAVVIKTISKKSTVVKKDAGEKVVKKELPKENSSHKASLIVSSGSLKQNVYDTKGHVVETITLPKEIFDAKVNNPLVAQAVRVYLANQRRGTVKTKSRGEVKISTRKIYKQKGTGRARHGAASAPIFVGGGIAFGPKPRDYSLKLNQKMRKLALFSALTTRLKLGEIRIIKGLEKLEPKTKFTNQALESLNLSSKGLNLLLVTPVLAKVSDEKPKSQENIKRVIKTAKNIKGVNILSANLLNTYEVLKNKHIVIMSDSIDGIKETFLKDK